VKGGRVTAHTRVRRQRDTQEVGGRAHGRDGDVATGLDAEAITADHDAGPVVEGRRSESLPDRP
jgi:hypothetical protein